MMNSGQNHWSLSSSGQKHWSLSSSGQMSSSGQKHWSPLFAHHLLLQREQHHLTKIRIKPGWGFNLASLMSNLLSPN